MLFSLSCNKQQDIIKDYTHKTNNCRHSLQLRHDWPHYTSDISAGYLIFFCPQSPAPGHCVDTETNATGQQKKDILSVIPPKHIACNN